jgi:hypothetical protein
MYIISYILYVYHIHVYSLTACFVLYSLCAIPTGVGHTRAGGGGSRPSTAEGACQAEGRSAAGLLRCREMHASRQRHASVSLAVGAAGTGRAPPTQGPHGPADHTSTQVRSRQRRSHAHLRSARPLSRSSYPSRSHAAGAAAGGLVEGPCARMRGPLASPDACLAV